MPLTLSFFFCLHDNTSKWGYSCNNLVYFSHGSNESDDRFVLLLGVQRLVIQKGKHNTTKYENESTKTGLETVCWSGFESKLNDSVIIWCTGIIHSLATDWPWRWEYNNFLLEVERCVCYRWLFSENRVVTDTFWSAMFSIYRRQRDICPAWYQPWGTQTCRNTRVDSKATEILGDPFFAVGARLCGPSVIPNVKKKIDLKKKKRR